MHSIPKKKSKELKKSTAANKVYNHQCPYPYKKKDFNSRNYNKTIINRNALSPQSADRNQRKMTKHT